MVAFASLPRRRCNGHAVALSRACSPAGEPIVEGAAWDRITCSSVRRLVKTKPIPLKDIPFRESPGTAL
jgi:hypothetical protein